MKTDDSKLTDEAAGLAHAAGQRLLSAFDPDNRPANRVEMITAVKRNEALSSSALRPALERLRPGIGWVSDAQGAALLPPGEWWVVDAVEGNVNHIHGMGEWAVSIALVRDNQVVLTAVHQPIGDRTWSAFRGGGARLNGSPLRVSAKSALADSIVGTGQAEAGQTDTYRRIGDSVASMLAHALLVRASVPSTFPLLTVAGGQTDAFWQFRPTLPGIAAGVLLVTEAGGVATRLDGSAWRPGSADILVATPGIHAAMVGLLGGAS